MSIKPLTLTSYLLAGWFFTPPPLIGKIDGLPCFLAQLCFAAGKNDKEKLSTWIHVELLFQSIYFPVSEIQYLNFHIKKSPKKYYGNISNSIFSIQRRLQLCEFRWLLLTSCYKHHSKSTKPRNNTAFFGWKSFPIFNKGIVVFGEVI